MTLGHNLQASRIIDIESCEFLRFIVNFYEFFYYLSSKYTWLNARATKHCRVTRMEPGIPPRNFGCQSPLRVLYPCSKRLKNGLLISENESLVILQTQVTLGVLPVYQAAFRNFEHHIIFYSTSCCHVRNFKVPAIFSYHPFPPVTGLKCFLVPREHQHAHWRGGREGGSGGREGGSGGREGKEGGSGGREGKEGGRKDGKGESGRQERSRGGEKGRRERERED